MTTIDDVDILANRGLKGDIAIYKVSIHCRFLAAVFSQLVNSGEYVFHDQRIETFWDWEWESR